MENLEKKAPFMVQNPNDNKFVNLAGFMEFISTVASPESMASELEDAVDRLARVRPVWRGYLGAGHPEEGRQVLSVHHPIRRIRHLDRRGGSSAGTVEEPA